MSEPDASGPPSLLRRLAALLYDTLLVIPLIGVTVAIASAIEMWLLGIREGSDYYQMNPQVEHRLCGGVFYPVLAQGRPDTGHAGLAHKARG